MARIAVIAVHGVADQQPNDSARQVASLLTDFGGGAFQSMGEDRLHIPVDPVLARDPNCGKPGASERSEWVRSRLETPSNPAACDDSSDEKTASYQFMHNQLRCYKKDEQRRAFDTIRIRLKRGADDVDVYEAYWADLSRLGNGMMVFFTQLYQLLLHLPSLGRVVTDYEAALQGSSGPWRAFSRVQGWAVRTLTLGIALLNLALATLIAPLVATHFSRSIQDETLWLLAGGVIALALVAVVGFVLSQLRSVPFVVWIGAPPLVGFGAFIGGAYLTEAISAATMVAAIAWIASAAVACYFLYQYDLRRPHALVVGIVFILLTGIVFGSYVVRMSPQIAEACLKTFVAIDALLTVVWSVHITLIVLALLLGWFASRRSCPERTLEARNGAWTARATLALSTSLFANLTLAGWMAVTNALGKLVKKDGISVYFFGRSQPYTFSEAIDKILLPNVRLGFLTVALATVLLIVALIWSIFPSVENEIKPPHFADSTKPGHSERLGTWLTTGLDALPRAVDVFTWVWVVLLIAGIWHGVHVFRMYHSRELWAQLIFAMYTHSSIVDQLLPLAGTLLLAMIATQVWLPAAGGALDVGLDVDNYIREHPSDDTPRARFAERFLSLFEYLWNGNYDKVVFVAHSQGTVITADLLRFLRIASGKRAFSCPTILFTMGCPLRQLYWRAFPPLYDWMTNELQMCDEVGVDEWINHYRSGDYVGRWVWNRTDGNEWDPNGAWHPGGNLNITDGCIGAGAHVHYWDGTANAIGKKLISIV
jgi:hypothetical protein